MNAAYVLMNVEAGKVQKAVTGLKSIKGVKTVHAVAGPYDIIAYVEAESLEKLGERVLLQVHHLTGIRSTVTAIVFQ
jgi:DNA-binding Lrp family transcriptional regulator